MNVPEGRPKPRRCRVGGFFLWTLATFGLVNAAVCGYACARHRVCSVHLNHIPARHLAVIPAWGHTGAVAVNLSWSYPDSIPHGVVWEERSPLFGGLTYPGWLRNTERAAAGRDFLGIRCAEFAWSTGTSSAPVIPCVYLRVHPVIWMLVCFAPLPAVKLLQRRRKRQRDAGNLCQNCGYDLRATPALCPECGLPPTSPQPATSSK